MRYAGALLIMAACALAGFIAAGKTAKRAAALGGAIAFLRLYAVELGSSLSPTGELIRSTAEISGAHSFAVSYAKLEASGVSLPEAWKRAVWDCRERLCLEKRDARLIAGLGDILGRYDAQGQIQAIAACIAQLDALREQAERLREQKAPVYRTLGVLAGAAAAIVIC